MLVNALNPHNNPTKYIIIIPILSIRITQPEVNFLKATLNKGTEPELKPFQSLCPFYCPTSLPASIWHAYSQRGFVPNFVLNKTNIRKNMHRTKRYHFKILSFLESLKE